jgi:hypothetical protein
MKNKDRRALLNSMKALKESGQTITSVTQNKQVLDRQIASEQRKFAAKGRTLWTYKQSDLVRCKHWQLGEFIGTVIEVNGDYAHLLGPMGSVHVPCQMLRLIDRFDDPCEESGA